MFTSKIKCNTKPSLSISLQTQKGKQKLRLFCCSCLFTTNHIVDNHCKGKPCTASAPDSKEPYDDDDDDDDEQEEEEEEEDSGCANCRLQVVVVPSSFLDRYWRRTRCANMQRNYLVYTTKQHRQTIKAGRHENNL